MTALEQAAAKLRAALAASPYFTRLGGGAFAEELINGFYDVNCPPLDGQTDAVFDALREILTAAVQP